LDWYGSVDESGKVRYEVYSDDVLIGSTDKSNFDFNGQIQSYYGTYITVKSIDIYGNYSLSNKKMLN
jgi:hypothetical protein